MASRGTVFIVHSAAHARAALAAAEKTGSAVTLESAPGAGIYGGGAYFVALIRQAAQTHPGAVFTAILDCGDQPGWAMAALDAGCKALRFHGKKNAAAPLAALAQQYGAQLLRGPAAGAIDLLYEKDPLAACMARLTPLSPAKRG